MRATLVLLSVMILWVPEVWAQGPDEDAQTFYVLLTEAAHRRLEAAAPIASRSVPTAAGTGLPALDALQRRLGVLVMRPALRPAGRFEARHREFGLHRWHAVTFPANADPERILADYRRLGEVEAIQRGNRFTALAGAPPNDPSYAGQDHYARIALADAWEIDTGDDGIVVSVIDSGIDPTHEDLAPALWTNSGEVPGNGLDDDGNGYPDDVHGWDFLAGGPQQFDPDQHGTHVAGTIGAVTNNARGVAGVAGGWGGGGVRLMVLRVLEGGDDSAICNAFAYSADMGAAISSNSWGCDEPCEEILMVRQCIDYFIENSRPGGGVVVFAAGNEETSILQPGAPSDYGPVIAVAATDASRNRASFSNFGSWVDISAPGTDVLSTVPGGGYDRKSGTSMAAPHVSGLAALLLSRSPNLSAEDVKRLIYGTRDGFGVAGQTHAGHALKALDFIDNQGLDHWVVRRYKAAGGHSVATTSGLQLAALGGYSGASVASGVYFAERHRVERTVSLSDRFAGDFMVFPIHGSPSVGWSPANPNLQLPYCTVASISGSSVTLANYVYSLLNILGQPIGWVPAKVGGSACAYGVVGELKCKPPEEGAWILTESCTIVGNESAPANVIVKAPAVLTVAASGSLDMDLDQHRLEVEHGAGVLIEVGGVIQ